MKLEEGAITTSSYKHLNVNLNDIKCLLNQQIFHNLKMLPSFLQRRRILSAMILAWCSPLIMSQSIKPPSGERDLQKDNIFDGVVTHPKNKRILKVRIRLPKVKKKSPLIIYSPGLGSGLSNGEAWVGAWVDAGYVVVTISHPITNDIIWDTQQVSFTQRLQQSLASPQYDLRVFDCQFVITECLLGSQSTVLQAIFPAKSEIKLEDFIDSARIGIAGHSYGALTVQSICRQTAGSLYDPRIKAAIAFSPGAMSQASAQNMRQVKVPFFCIMGDQDNQVTFKKGAEKMTLGMPLAKRRWVYDNLPKGLRQLWIVSPADHMSFAGEVVDSQSFSRDIAIEPKGEQETWDRINEMTTRFWNYHLRAESKNHVLPAAAAEYEKSLQNFLQPKDVFEIG
jgi:predicted dienelactone hydrolase